MKKTLFISFALFSLISCNKKENGDCYVCKGEKHIDRETYFEDLDTIFPLYEEYCRFTQEQADSVAKANTFEGEVRWRERTVNGNDSAYNRINSVMHCEKK